MMKELNSAFENVHPQVKVAYTEIEPGKYEVSMRLHDVQGKFRSGSGGEQVFSQINDERFIAMVKGSAKGFAEMLEGEEDVYSMLEYFGPSELINEHVLRDEKLNSVDDFAAKLNTMDARKALMVQAYIFEQVQKAGVNPEDFSEAENEAFFSIGSFQLSYTFPPMRDLSIAIGKAIKYPQTWALFANWIKEWAGASQWSCNYAWDGGPLYEELLAYGTYILLENEGAEVKKQAWWSKLSMTVDICLDFEMDDLEMAGFVVG